VQLPRRWRGLTLFWVGVVSAGCIGAMTLQILGPPPYPPRATAKRVDVPAVAAPAPEAMTMADVAPVEAPPPIAARVEFPEVVPTGVAMPVETAAAVAASEEEVSAVGLEPVVMVERTSSSSDEKSPAPPAAVIGGEAPAAGAPEAPPPAKKLHLRIVRDSRQCGKADCSKWTIVAQRGRRLRPITIDIAPLRLAPALRQSAEKGEIALLIDAVERHETVGGRDIVMFVATSLTGVAYNDAANRAELLPLPAPGASSR